MIFYIIGWYLTGVILCLISCRIIDYLTYGDLIVSFLFGILGPICIIHIVYATALRLSNKRLF